MLDSDWERRVEHKNHCGEAICLIAVRNAEMQ
jgi:hypothetical protein